MKKAILFAKRNITEMLRDPLLYIFCIGFPVGMILMFQLILHYSGEATPVFLVKSLIPGVMMFSYSILMLMSSLLISKDKSSAFLKRLFTSPLKPSGFILGYFIPFLFIGIIQSILCILMGYIFGATSGTGFISFGQSILLIIEMLPIMIFNIMLGMMLGTLLNDKSAPAITSIFISASGIIGGAWMPVDTMGDFEKAVGFLPFYPSVYLGRIITGASHTQIGPETPGIYEFGTIGIQYVIVISLFTILSIFGTILFFKKKMSSDNF